MQYKGYAGWSTNGGQCALVVDDEYRVKIIEAGRGEYASYQRAPRGFSDSELEEIARAAARAVHQEPPGTSSYLNSASLPYGARILNGTDPLRGIVEVKVPKR